VLLKLDFGETVWVEVNDVFFEKVYLPGRYLVVVDTAMPDSRGEVAQFERLSEVFPLTYRAITSNFTVNVTTSNHSSEHLVDVPYVAFSRIVPTKLSLFVDQPHTDYAPYGAVRGRILDAVEYAPSRGVTEALGATKTGCSTDKAASSACETVEGDALYRIQLNYYLYNDVVST
jgi:hypothetical protein